MRITHRRGAKLVLAMAVAAGVFGIVTVVQAAIPDANGVAHGCVVSNNPIPAKNYLRMIDTEHGMFCQPYETPVNFAASSGTTGFVGAEVWYGNGEVFSNNGAGVNIALVNVPAGTYLVSATGWAAGLSAGLKDARCYINNPTGDASDTFTSVGLDTVDIGGQTSWAVQKLVSTGGGSIFARCLDSAAAGEVLYGAQITAQSMLATHGTVFSPSSQGGATSPTPHH